MSIQPFQKHFSAQKLTIFSGNSLHLFILQTITKFFKYINIKNFCSLKDIMNSVNEQITDWKEILKEPKTDNE